MSSTGCRWSKSGLSIAQCREIAVHLGAWVDGHHYGEAAVYLNESQYSGSPMSSEWDQLEHAGFCRFAGCRQDGVEGVYHYLLVE